MSEVHKQPKAEAPEFRELGAKRGEFYRTRRGELAEIIDNRPELDLPIIGIVRIGGAYDVETWYSTGQYTKHTEDGTSGFDLMRKVDPT